MERLIHISNYQYMRVYASWTIGYTYRDIAPKMVIHEKHIAESLQRALRDSILSTK